MNKIRVRVADWQKDNAELRRIREAVFIAEQSVPPELEWDAEDDEAVHFLAYEGEYAIGTARLLGDGHIGRVSVLKDWRGLKVGDALMRAAIEEAERRGLKRQLLTARRSTPFPSTSDWASRSIAANSSMPACPMSTWFATATEAR